MQTLLREFFLALRRTLCYSSLVLIFSTAVAITTSAQAPVISSFFPASGPVGTTVTITGTNFDPVAANNIVYFGAVKAIVTSATGTSLTVTVPTGATYQPITVTTNGLTGYSTKPFNVTFPNSGANFSNTSFATAVNITTSPNPHKVSVIDIDGDGKLDLVYTTVDNTKTISVQRNISSGDTYSFAGAVSYPFPYFPSDFRTADFNGDGKLDLIVIDRVSAVISIFRNLSTVGTIAFAPRVDYPLGRYTLSELGVADFDGDGKPDFVLSSSFPVGGYKISGFRNISTSTTIAFAESIAFERTNFSMPTLEIVGIAAGDFNGDGKPDLVTTDPYTNIISLFTNTSTNGNIAFTSGTYLEGRRAPSGVKIGDLDGDGRLDFAVSDEQLDVVSIFRNTSSSGSLSFAAKVDYPNSHTANLAIGDLDGEGKPDLAATASYSGTTVSVLKNWSFSGTIAFAPKMDYETGIGPYGVAIGDMDGDGRPELVTANHGSNSISILKNQTTATCTLPAFRTANVVVTNPFCRNNNDQIRIVPTCGVAPFSYSINGGATFVSGPDSGYTFRNLTSGAFKVQIKDAEGNLSEALDVRLVVDVGYPAFLNNNLIVLDASCANNDGNISIIPTSGTAPFMYSKDGGATYVAGPNSGSGFVNLSAETYKLRLKDANGCESGTVERKVALNCTATTTCTPPTFKNDGTIVLDASCGNNDGQISIIPTSGTAPFMYSLDGGATYKTGANTGSGFTNLAPGTHKLRLKDANGCESAIVERTVRAIYGGPTFTYKTAEATCGNKNGSITIVPTSGAGPFMYSIDGGMTYVEGPAIGYTFSNLAANTYYLKIKNVAGCESAIIYEAVKANFSNCSGTTVQAGITTIQNAINTEAISLDTIKAYPNPTKGQFKLQVKGFISSKAEVSIFNGEGKMVQKRPLNLQPINTLDFDLTGQAKGMYYIKITSNSGTRTSKVLVQ